MTETKKFNPEHYTQELLAGNYQVMDQYEQMGINLKNEEIKKLALQVIELRIRSTNFIEDDVIGTLNEETRILLKEAIENDDDFDIEIMINNSKADKLLKKHGISYDEVDTLLEKNAGIITH